MGIEVLDNKEVTERWNLSDDEDYVDINTVDDEYHLLCVCNT